MRVIKFRGKDIETGEWVYGDLHVLCDRPHIHTEPTAYPYAGKRSFVVPETIGQFTGLFDKNNNEIYEGDIISSKSHPKIKHMIFYSEKQGKFIAGLYGKTNIYDFGVCGIDIPAWMAEKEVVGNIYDNPELLEEGGEQ